MNNQTPQTTLTNNASSLFTRTASYFQKSVGVLFAGALLSLGVALPDTQAAGFQIRVTDVTAGTPAMVVTDNLLGDLSLIIGSINTTFTTTNFSIVTTIGTSKPLGGNSPSLNRIDLLNVNVTSATGGGTLMVEITDTDFTNASMAALGGTFTTNIGGTLGLNANTLLAETFWDASNAGFGTSSPLSTLGAFSGPGAFAGNDVVNTAPLAGLNGPFSMTQRLTISMVANDIISYDSDLIAQAQPVPEPSTMFLLGSGLLGLIGYRRKFCQA